MNLKKTRVRILHSAEKLSQKAASGVSLHCHTEHSREMLDFVPHYAAKLPIINFFWQRERKKYQEREGKEINFSTGFWSPPLTAQEVYDLEKKQINEAGLDALVSLSDHDSIAANLKVNEQTENAKAPISLEWTVPFEYGFFHVGVHNLPKNRADELTQILLDYTFNKENHTGAKLNEVFALLNSIPQILIVLNHPLWDIEIVGKEKHRILLDSFIKQHGRWIHAFEINGFRKWSENKAVIEMAEALNYPVVTGGDRHGCQPNTVINLTNSKTFDEFADEVRDGKPTEIVFMPEYKQPLQSRQLQSFSEILRHYPEFPEGRKKWFDRVHFDVGDGHGLRPLSVHWIYGGPAWLRAAIWTLGVFGSPKARPIFSLTRKKQDRVPKHFGKTEPETLNLEEAAPSLSSDPVS